MSSSPDGSPSSSGKRLKMTHATLYILTPFSLLGLKLDGKSGFPAHNTPLTPSSFDTYIKLSENNFPTRMGFVKWNNSQILLFGGLTNDEGSPVPGVNEANLKAYILDPATAKNSLSLYEGGGEMKSFKRHPFVERFGDEVYVNHLATHGRYNPSPVLECFNPSSGRWRQIPDLPGICHFKSKSGEDEITMVLRGGFIRFGQFVAFDKIFFPYSSDDKVLHCFDMATQKWDSSCAWNFVHSLAKVELPLPRWGRSFAGLSHQLPLYISSNCSLILSPNDETFGLTAQMVHRSGHLMFYQQLDLPGCFHSELICTHIVNLDEDDARRMCFIAVVAIYAPSLDFVLYMCNFDVQILPQAKELADTFIYAGFGRDSGIPAPEEKTFMKVVVVEQQCYNIPELAEADMADTNKFLIV